MFVIRRSFRGPNGPLIAGSVVEPADVRNFKYRVLEQHIVEINEQNFQQYKSFFKLRYGVDIPQLPNKVLKKPKEVTAKKTVVKVAKKNAE